MLKKMALVFIVIILSSCSSSFESVKEKIDPALLQTMNEHEMNGNYDYIPFVIICKVEPGYEILDEISITGSRIIKHSGKMVTAIGTFEDIKKTAKLNFIEKMNKVFEGGETYNP